MHHKIPVITSEKTSMSEIAGEAAILVDPNNPKEVAKSMELLMTDKTLQESYIEKGIKQVKKYNWDKSAAQIYTLLNSISQD